MDPFVNPYATWIGSPNYWANRNGHSPNWVGPGVDASWTLLHITDCTEASAVATFQSAAAQRSAQYEIPKDACLVADPSAPFGYRPVGIKQLVNEGDAAWHSGNGDMNENSDGIEHERTQTDLDDHAPFTMGQRLCSMWLVADIARRRNRPITSQYVIGHGETAGAIGPIYGLGRGVTSTACPDDFPKAEIVKGAAMFLAGQDPHALYVAEPLPAVTIISGVSVPGRIYDTPENDRTKFVWATLVPMTMPDGSYDAIPDKTDIVWDAAHYVNGVWFLHVVGTTYAVTDGCVDDTDATHDVNHSSPPDFAAPVANTNTLSTPVAKPKYHDMVDGKVLLVDTEDLVLAKSTADTYSKANAGKTVTVVDDKGATVFTAFVPAAVPGGMGPDHDSRIPEPPADSRPVVVPGKGCFMALLGIR